jgi:hypothetical protein
MIRTMGEPMDEQQTTALMAESLREGLSHLRGRPVTVRELRREFFPRSSSFRAERLRVRLDGGEWLEVFFKDLSPQHRLNEALVVRTADLGPSRREPLMYQQILSPERFGTPRLYASRWAPSAGTCWLFLEDVGGGPLVYNPDFSLWLAAARWAAGFHAATRDLPAGQTRFLRPYGRAEYRGCVERIERKLPGLDAAYRPAVCRALDYYAGIVDRLEALPQSVIHGELFGKNIVVRAGRSDGPLAVIDWESAALGPSYLDLVSVSMGKWPASQKEVLWRTYFDRYQAGTGLRLDWGAFCQDLRRLAVHHTLKWLAWRPDWDFSMKRWLRELEQAVPSPS